MRIEPTDGGGGVVSTLLRTKKPTSLSHTFHMMPQHSNAVVTCSSVTQTPCVMCTVAT